MASPVRILNARLVWAEIQTSRTVFILGNQFHAVIQIRSNQQEHGNACENVLPLQQGLSF
jgi:hypothetical protein